MCYNYTQCTSGIPLFLLFHTALFLLLFTFPFFFPLLLPAFWITSRELSSLSLSFFFFLLFQPALSYSSHLKLTLTWSLRRTHKTMDYTLCCRRRGKRHNSKRTPHTHHTHTHTHTQTRSTTFRIRSSGRLIKAIWLVGDVWIYIENQEI